MGGIGRSEVFRRLSRKALRLLVVVAVTYVGVCVFVEFFQARLIYFPARGYRVTPQDIGLPFEAVDLRADDGVRLAAWYVAVPEAVATVLFCHGNAGNISDRLVQLQLLAAMKCNVLMFDYRGFGESEGSPTEDGTYRDAEAAWRFLTETKGQPPNRIVYFGESLGGAVAVELAVRHPPGALVLESTFTSLADVGRLHYPLLPVGWLLRYRYASIEKVSKLTCPKLFIHAQEDTLVPLANARRLFDAAAAPKEFLETPGEHNTGGFTYSPEFSAKVGAFLSNTLNPR